MDLHAHVYIHVPLSRTCTYKHEYKYLCRVSYRMLSLGGEM